jgi:5-methylcytosine-specific restriction endonuclease McrBC regulatory subunit McrC
MVTAMMIKTKDNSVIPVDSHDDIKNLSLLAGIKIEDIINKDPELLIFPRDLNKYHDDIDKSPVFTISSNQLMTNNIMGFISVNDTQLCIASRFDDNEDNYFLHYLLQKVFSLNIFDFKFNTGFEAIWDFYKYLFPYFLNNALKQGLYKTYIRNNYNNEKLKGVIDVKRHIRLNIPYQGKNAYTTREHSYDNAITQLIRHTIEYMKTSPLGIGFLSSNNETTRNVRTILENTANYNKNDRAKIISINSKKLNHPYFVNYSILQRICLQILKKKRITFGTDKNKIYGLLFDGAWLWEEYLNKVFLENGIGLEHPRNKEKTGGDYLFADRQQSIYPDFIKRKNTNKTAYYVGDAKYKHLDKKVDKTNKDDYYQLITYMYRYECNKGFLFFPYSGNEKIYKRRREINGITKNRVCTEIGLKIEQSEIGFKEFRKSMENNEKQICECMANNE